MSKHTPGPWHVGSGIYILASNNYVIAKSGAPIHMHNEITDANMRLIAAAPDMLAALERAADYIATVRHDGNEGLLRQVHAAIAKAEGTF